MEKTYWALAVLLAISYGTIGAQFRNATVPAFPLRSADVNGKMVIVDSEGARVKLACVNWYGFQLEDLVLNGLDRQPLEKITARIVELGFNCVRLVYALDVFYKDPVVSPDRLSANPELMGSTSFELFDKTVQVLTDAHLMVVLNNHVSSAGWCCSINDGEGLWYTDKYPEEVFFEHWSMLAERYNDNPWVIGADLRNEIRAIPGGIVGHIPETWGTGWNASDWKLAAEEAARRIQDVNGDMLIIVGGVLSNVVLTPAYYAPVKIPNQSKLVYTGHIYAFSTALINLPYEVVETLFFSAQRFVQVSGHDYSAPFWMGEFGDNSNSENWQKIYRHIKDNDLDWAYWPLDGYKYPGDDESFGILEDDFWTVRHDWKLEQLQQIMPALSN